MKIAVSYENGNVFEHFGKTENFKVYEIENGEITNSEVVGTNGTGHEALAVLLGQMGVEAVVCGGIGDGAIAALNAENIEIYSGIEGSADEAAELFAKDELVSKDGHCDHHDHEEAEEGCEGCGGNCGGGCSGCGGGCSGPQMLEGKNAGKIVKVHYRGTFDDGEQFDSSYDRGEPLEFICGTGMMIRGFDKAVVDMEVGEAKDVHLMPAEAYGEYNNDAVFTINLADLPGAESLEAGRRIVLSNAYGQNFPALVAAKTEETITFDTNHQMAGKELNFHIELLEVK